jgi:hypothetical protein
MHDAPAMIDLPSILDMEASGFGPHSYPLEVGYVLSDGRSFCTLIRPEPNWTHWDAQAEDTHHISRHTAFTHGRPAREVAEHLNEDLRGLTLYSDGWANDYTWLNVLFEAAQLSPRFRLDNLRAVLSENEADQWHVVKEQVARELGSPRHRASADARVLQRTLARLRGAN